MTLNDIQQLLSQSFKDHKLDDAEKREVIELLQQCNDEQRSFARNQAFKLARAVILNEKGEASSALRWLERTIKALDQSVPSLKAEVHFSPGEACRRAITTQCLQATQTIDICVFTISDNTIRDALLAAHKRGVAVRIISDNDKSEDLGSDVDDLAAAGIPTRMDTTRHHMHHKYAIFDSKVLINGSFNWTRSASEWNQENITVIESASLVAHFEANFEQLWDTYD